MSAPDFSASLLLHHRHRHDDRQVFVLETHLASVDHLDMDIAHTVFTQYAPIAVSPCTPATNNANKPVTRKD